MKPLQLLLAASGILISLSTQANLIANSGFEENNVQQASWQWFKSKKVDGWRGSNIEIWNAFNGVNAYQGSQFAELNSHGPNRGAFSIWQKFNTVAGKQYSLSFAYRARTAGYEAFQLDVNGNRQSLLQQVFDDHSNKHWSTFTTDFTATSGKTKMMFTSLIPGTIGNFLDEIKVVSKASTAPATSVPEPEMPYAMALGLGFIALMRHKLLKEKVKK